MWGFTLSTAADYCYADCAVSDWEDQFGEGFVPTAETCNSLLAPACQYYHKIRHHVAGSGPEAPRNGTADTGGQACPWATNGYTFHHVAGFEGRNGIGNCNGWSLSNDSTSCHAPIANCQTQVGATCMVPDSGHVLQSNILYAEIAGCTAGAYTSGAGGAACTACDNGFSPGAWLTGDGGTNCHNCNPGNGFVAGINGSHATKHGAECVPCAQPEFNDQFSQTAPCALQECAQGYGVKASGSWDTGSTTPYAAGSTDTDNWDTDLRADWAAKRAATNCEQCAATDDNSPAGSGQCVCKVNCYNEDAGTDMSLNKNNHSDAFCAEGYKLVASDIGTGHASFDTGNGTADDGLTGANATTFQTCEKCPADQTSGGGTSRSCHALSSDWATCSHVACQLEEFATKACAKHTSSNPSAALSTPSIVIEKECHDWTTTNVTRIKVFHHGHEHKGTSHMCKLNGTRADSDRPCVCQCKTTTVAEQKDQQDDKEADDATYATRSAAQAARGEGGAHAGHD